MHVYMSRHGESLNNVLNIIGGDCRLSEHGKTYSKFLRNYFSNSNLTVWTSNLKRTKETAEGLSSNIIALSNLNEINAGDFDGLDLNNIRTNYPNQYLIRDNNKLTERYPNGESYLDLQNRVLPVIDCIDMSNSNSSLLIISHQAVCRVIYSYFTKRSLSDCIDTKIDLHNIYKLVDGEFISIKSNV